MVNEISANHSPLTYFNTVCFKALNQGKYFICKKMFETFFEIFWVCDRPPWTTDGQTDVEVEIVS